MLRLPRALPRMIAKKFTYPIENLVQGDDFARVFQNIWRGNDPHDPDFRVGGGQPYGWDEWNALYKVYRCYASKVKVYFEPLENLNNDIPLMECAVVPREETDVLLGRTWESIKQLPQLRWRQMRNRNSERPKTFISYFMSGKRMFGLRQDPEDIVTFTSAPTRQWYWHLLIGCGSGVNQPDANTNWRISGEITYYCVLQGPKVLNLS